MGAGGDRRAHPRRLESPSSSAAKAARKAEDDRQQDRVGQELLASGSAAQGRGQNLGVSIPTLYRWSASLHRTLSVLYLMRWSLLLPRYYAEDRLSFGEPSWKTLRLLVSIWVRTLSIFIVRIVVGRPFTVKIHPTKANRISGDMPGNNHRDGSLWRFSLYGTQAGRVRAFSKADITAICPPIR